MKKWYLCTIRQDIPYNYFGIANIHKYAGKKIYVYKKVEWEDNYNYVGGLFNNKKSHSYSWCPSCFSQIQEL